MNAQSHDNINHDVRSRLLKMIMENEKKRHLDVSKPVARR